MTITVQIKSNDKELKKKMGLFQRKHLPKATANAINEIGATFKYRTAMEIGEFRLISGAIFSEMNIETFSSRCYECRATKDEKFLIKVLFVGLKDEERKKIRLFCRNLWVTQKNAS